MLTTSLHASWRHVMSLSRLREGEKVIVLGAQSGRSQYKSIALQVAREMGGAAAYLEVENPNKLPESAIPALRAADLLIDLSHAHDPVIRQLGRDGTRTLVVLEPPEILERMLPQESDKARVESAQKCIKSARKMRVTSAAGTDFEVELGELKGNCQYGFADEPGHWDQWPGAFVTTYGNDGSAQGQIVIDAGDIIFPQKDYVRSPIRLMLEDGYIRSIEGGVDAKLLKSTLDSYNNPEVFAVSHLGWGLSRNCRWDALSFYDKQDIEGQEWPWLLRQFPVLDGAELVWWRRPPRAAPSRYSFGRLLSVSRWCAYGSRRCRDPRRPARVSEAHIYFELREDLKDVRDYH
jgi:2,5-dihydroxypyridine 5,6-dioxygenase